MASFPWTRNVAEPVMFRGGGAPHRDATGLASRRSARGFSAEQCHARLWPTTPQDYPEWSGFGRRRARESGSPAAAAGSIRRPHPCASTRRPIVRQVDAVCTWLLAGGSGIQTLGTAWHNRVFERGSCRLRLLPRSPEERREREPTPGRCPAPSAGPMVRIRFPPARSLARTWRRSRQAHRTSTAAPAPAKYASFLIRDVPVSSARPNVL